MNGPLYSVTVTEDTLGKHFTEGHGLRVTAFQKNLWGIFKLSNTWNETVSSREAEHLPHDIY